MRQHGPHQPCLQHSVLFVPQSSSPHITHQRHAVGQDLHARAGTHIDTDTNTHTEIRRCLDISLFLCIQAQADPCNGLHKRTVHDTFSGRFPKLSFSFLGFYPMCLSNYRRYTIVTKSAKTRSSDRWDHTWQKESQQRRQRSKIQDRRKQ